VQPRVGGGRAQEPKSYFSAAVSELTAPENQSVLRSVVLFGVSPSCEESDWEGRERERERERERMENVGRLWCLERGGKEE